MLSKVRYFLANSITAIVRSAGTRMSAKKGSTMGIDDVGRMRKMMEEMEVHEEYISAACKFAEYDAPVVMFPQPRMHWTTRKNNTSSLLICVATCLQECRGEVIVLCSGRSRAKEHFKHINAICARDGAKEVPTRLMDCQPMIEEELTNAPLFEGVTFLPSNTRKSAVFVKARTAANKRLITIVIEATFKLDILQYSMLQTGIGKMLVFYESMPGLEKEEEERTRRVLNTEEEYEHSIRHLKIEKEEEGGWGS